MASKGSVIPKVKTAKKTRFGSNKLKPRTQFRNAQNFFLGSRIIPGRKKNLLTDLFIYFKFYVISMAKKEKFYDLKKKKAFFTTDYKSVTKNTKRGVRHFIVAQAPSGIESWKIVSGKKKK